MSAQEDGQAAAGDAKKGGSMAAAAPSTASPATSQAARRSSVISLADAVRWWRAMQPLTRGLCAALLILWAGSTLSEGFANSMSLIPANTFLRKHDIWNMITGALVEQNVLKLAITFGVVAYGGSVLEPKFGTKQLAMYLGAVTLVSSVVISLAVIFGYMITFRESLLSEDIYGGAGLCICFAIGLHQDSPESFVPIIGHLQHKHLPLVLLGLDLVLEFLFGAAGDASFACFALPLGWAYLRFVKPNDPDATLLGEAPLPPRGDWRPEFEFLTLFPDPVRPPAVPIVLFLSHTIGKMQIFQQPDIVAEDQVAKHGAESRNAASVGVAVSERRKAKGRDALAQLEHLRSKRGLDSKASPAPRPAPSDEVGVAATSTPARTTAAV